MNHLVINSSLDHSGNSKIWEQEYGQMYFVDGYVILPKEIFCVMIFPTDLRIGRYFNIIISFFKNFTFWRNTSINQQKNYKEKLNLSGTMWCFFFKIWYFLTIPSKQFKGNGPLKEASNILICWNTVIK